MSNIQNALQALLNKNDKESTTFEQRLENNIKATCEILQIECSQIKHLIPDLIYNLDSCDDAHWNFISLCFHLLLFEKKDEEIQSVKHLANIRIAFQFIISLAVLPNLIPGIGVDMSKRFKNADKLPVQEIGIKDKYYRLRATTKVLLKCLKNEKLRIFLLENHFSDILASLLQLTYAPLKKPNKNDPVMSEEFYLEVINDRKDFENILQDVMKTTHQPLVFRELMFLKGNKNAPNWFKNKIYQILSERVQLKNGVESIIRALFDAESDDTGAKWKHWDILTKLLMAKPSNCDEKIYYDNICGQLLSLLNNRSFDNKRIIIFERSVILSTKHLYELNEIICAKNLINPLINTLYTYTEKINTTDANSLTTKIEQNIFILHSVFVDDQTNGTVLPITYIKPIFLVLFNLYSALQRKSPNQILTEEVKKLILKYLDNCSEKEKKYLYEYFLFDKNVPDITTVKNGYYFNTENEITLQKTETENMQSYSKSDCFIFLLEKSQNEILTISYFKYLLERLITIYQHYKENSEVKSLEQQLFLIHQLVKITDNKIVMNNSRKHPADLIIFAKDFLKILTDKSIHKQTESDSPDFQILYIIIMLLNYLLENSDRKNLLKKFNVLEVLHKIIKETPNKELKGIISEIISNGNDKSESEKTQSEYDMAVEKMYSSVISEQAYGLAKLVKLIEKKDPETYQRKQFVLIIFQQNLKNEESFIYLRAIAGLAALADAFPNTVLETLTDEYINPKGITEKDNEVRMKLGEVLIRVTSSLGEVAVKYKSLLLNTFLQVVHDPDPLIRASSLSNLGEVCKVLGYKLGTIIIDILNCINDIILYELAVEVRRAAVCVIRQLFVGLDKQLLAFLKEDILPIYRSLKKLYRDDPDSVTRLQAQLALEELNEIMKSLLAPELNVEKNFVIP